MWTASILTISTTGAKGERIDTSGDNLINILKNNGYDVKCKNIIPDDFIIIKNELIRLCDENINLILTTGGTGFSKSDVTPEATRSIIEKEVPGIPEMMRVMNYKNTYKSALSRGICGIRKNTLIINLPGSKKAAEENINVVLDILGHALETLSSNGSLNCGG